jgi:outer membrane protein assembly factor BamB
VGPFRLFTRDFNPEGDIEMQTNMTRIDPFFTRAVRWLGLAGVPILLLASLCQGQVAGQGAPSRGSTATNTNWSEFHNRNMVRWNPYEKILNVKTVRNLKLKWTYATGTAVYSSPAVVNGVAYIGSADGNVYALDANTGTKLWNYQTGDVVSNSPAVANGVVYVGSNDDYMYALNASTGSLVWRHGVGFVDSSAPAVANDTVYVGVVEYEGPSLYALDTKTGTKLWTIGSGWVQSSPAVANGVVYFAFFNGPLCALKANTGHLLWYLSGFGGSPAVKNGVVYAGGNNGMNALDASNGAVLWNYPEAGPGDSSPAVADGVVYFAAGSEESFVYALNAKTGAELWRRTLVSTSESSPAVANGVVFVGSDDHNLYAFNAKTGAKLWNYNTGTGSPVLSSPVIVNGVVYVGAGNGNVYAFGLKK